MERATARTIDDVAAGRRSAYQALFEDLLDWWESDQERFDACLTALAKPAAADEGLARDLLLTLIHQLGLARPAIVRLTVDSDIITEVAQSTLFQVERNIHRFEGRAALRTWLHSIARNEALMYFRRQQRQAMPAGADDDVADNRIGRLSSSVATRTTVEEAVKKLPEPYRETLQLRFFSQLAYQEIADTIDVPIGTVRSRVSKGRKLLGASLGL